MPLSHDPILMAVYLLGSLFLPDSLPASLYALIDSYHVTAHRSLPTCRLIFPTIVPSFDLTTRRRSDLHGDPLSLDLFLCYPTYNQNHLPTLGCLEMYLKGSVAPRMKCNLPSENASLRTRNLRVFLLSSFSTLSSTPDDLAFVVPHKTEPPCHHMSHNRDQDHRPVPFSLCPFYHDLIS